MRTDASGETSGDERSRDLYDIVADYADRINAGEAFEPDAILAEHPELCGEILDQLQAFISLPQPAAGGQTLGRLGDYTLHRLIGRGGMGVVYEARENSMDRRVALKVLPAGIAADPRACARFLREAQTAGKLSHPNVVPVFFTGIKEQTPFYAMEFVDGETLAQVLKRQKQAPEDAATPFGPRSAQQFYFHVAEVFVGVAEGLQHAHSMGVIHRDLKPSNLILDRRVAASSSGGFTLRILDFGLAHLEGQESLTASGDLVGTVVYMSPEQAQRKRVAVDHRTDIYSLGATLYEVLAGRPPLRGKDCQDTLSQIIERDPVNPRKMDARIPRDLETIVLKCLRKEPAGRYGTAEALAQDLRRFVRGDPVESRPESRWEKLVRRVRKNRAALLVAGVLTVLLGALGGIAWERHVERQTAEKEARKAARLLHDATVRDAAIEILCGQLILLREQADALSSLLFIFRSGKFRKGPAGVQDLLSALAQAAEAVPERPDAPFFLARLYRLAGEEDAANREAHRALERDGGFVPAEVLAREIALGRGSLPDDEIEVFLARFSEEGGWQEPWLRAYRHTLRRNWPEAVDAYRRLLKFREPEPYVGFAVEALMGRGNAHLHAGDFLGAISDFAGAHGIWPRLSEAGFALGVAWHRAGQLDQAEKVFLDLYERHAESPGGAGGEIAAWISGFYGSSGDRAKADAWLERMDGWARGAVFRQFLYWEGRYEECIEDARRVLGKRPDEWAPLVLLCWARLQLQWRRWGPWWDEERREILDLARKANALYPNDRHTRCLLAMALQVNGRWEEALTVIEEAIRHRVRTGEEDYYDSALQAAILRLQGRPQEAEEILLQALEVFPGNRSLRFELALTYEVELRDEDAQWEYLALTDGGRGSAREYAQLAGVLNRLGRYDEAAEAAQEALRRLPRNTSAWEHLARALRAQGRSDEALAAVEAGIEELPGRERLHLVKGGILEDLGRLEEAARSYSLELALRLDDAVAHAAFAGLLKRQPDLAALAEVQDVADAIERRRNAGGATGSGAGNSEALLRDTLLLLRESKDATSGTRAIPGK